MTGTTEVPRHPAKFSHHVLDAIDDIMFIVAFSRTNLMILDPFAGVGGIHHFDRYGTTIGVELEPEWAATHPRTIVGDALHLPFADDTFDVTITSPCYGNRMADHHEARDASRRNTYRHALDRPLSVGSSAAMQWGEGYKAFHRAAWTEVKRVTRHHGALILNISDHIRKGQREPVSDWHRVALQLSGWHMIETQEVTTPRNRFGANNEARVAFESVYTFRKEA